jgi:hypothetical protein
VICTFVCLSPRVVYSVALVEPVELHRIWRAQVEPLRGTGGTGVGLGFCWREGPVPPVPPFGTTKNRQKRLKYHRFHRLHLAYGGPRARSKTPFGRSLESLS